MLERKKESSVQSSKSLEYRGLRDLPLVRRISQFHSSCAEDCVPFVHSWWGQKEKGKRKEGGRNEERKRRETNKENKEEGEERNQKELNKRKIKKRIKEQRRERRKNEGRRK